MNPLEIFWYWINERHLIYLKKLNGEKKPWTNDWILQNYKFTNVFRELDKTTVWCRENIRTHFDGSDLLFVLSIFRQTGSIDAGIQILNYFDCVAPVNEFDFEEFAEWMIEGQDNGMTIYTGAYMVTGSYPEPKGTKKIYSQAKHCFQPVWEHRHELFSVCRSQKSLEAFTKAISRFPGWGGNNFMSYEVACDLRYTHVLRDARDIYSWANPGPGALRGLNRIHGRSKNYPLKKKQAIDEMRKLLGQSQFNIGGHVQPDLELREIEHSLCEFDKYMRVKNEEGRPRGRYNGC